MSNNESTKTTNQSDNILEVSHLKKYFPIKGGFFGGDRQCEGGRRCVLQH